MTGPAASEGVVQGAPAKEIKPPGALVPSRKGCMAHQLALGVKKWEEILQQVLSIPFEESKWIWKVDRRAVWGWVLLPGGIGKSRTGVLTLRDAVPAL